MMSSAPGPSHTSNKQTQAVDLASSQTSTRRTARATEVSGEHNLPGSLDDAPASFSRSTKRTSKMQRSSSHLDSNIARSVNYTRTGRISKAKKGVKGAHACACGKSYSRAEHLRRHQQNHGETLYCSYPDCDKTFHREDLLRRHEKNHATGEVMDHSNSRSPSVIYTTAPAMEPALSAGLSHTPAYSPALTQTTLTSQPSTPFNDPSTIMSAPRYTVSQFNQFRRSSQPTLLGPFLSSDAKHRTAQATGLGLHVSPVSSMPSSMPSQIGIESRASLGDGEMSASTPFSGTSYEPIWNSHYNNTYMTSRSSPIITSNQPWPQAARIHGSVMSPSSALSTQQPFWFSADKSFDSVDASLALSNYPMDLQLLPTAHDTVSPYQPCSTTGWDQASLHSMTPVTIKAELSSPITMLDAQTLSKTLNDHAKQSYIDAYWEYMHPLYPILHKPTMEQQRRVDYQQSDSDLLLKAAIVICGAAFTKEESRWADGRILLKKALQYAEQEQVLSHHDLRVSQALFLIEAYAQFHSQRAPTQLSHYFNTVVNQLQQDTDVRSAATKPLPLASPFTAEQLSPQWQQWIFTHSKQRLLLACSVLMTQIRFYLSHDANMPQLPWQDIVLPCSTTLWHAASAMNWQTLLPNEPQAGPINATVDLLQDLHLHGLDRFQSIILSTAYASSMSGNLASASKVLQVIPDIPEVQLHLHASLLSQIAPLSALLAIAGESWTPAGGRLATHARTAAAVLGRMKNTLRSWVIQCFVPLKSTSLSSNRRGSVTQELSTNNATHRAVQHALTILRIAAHLEEQQRALPFAGEIPIYIATLVLWAVGHEAMRRSINPNYGTMTPPTSGSSDFTSAGALQGLVAFIHAAQTDLLSRICAGPDMNIALQWRQGVDATMRWTRLRVGGFTPIVPSNVGGLAPESSAAGAARPRSQSMPQMQSIPQQQPHFPQQAQLGELHAGVINVLRRLEARGWAGAWF